MASRLHSSASATHAPSTSALSLPKKCCRSTSPRSRHSSASRCEPRARSSAAAASSFCSVISDAIAPLFVTL